MPALASELHQRWWLFAARLLYKGSDNQQLVYYPTRPATESRLPPAQRLSLNHCSFHNVASIRNKGASAQTRWHALYYSAQCCSCQGTAHRTAPASFSCAEASAAGGSSTGASAGRKRRRRPFIGPKGGTHSSFGSTWDSSRVDLLNKISREECEVVGGGSLYWQDRNDEALHTPQTALGVSP